MTNFPEIRAWLGVEVSLEHRTAADSLSRLSGAGYSRAFREAVIAHHREALLLIDESLPYLRDPAVRELAEQIRANQLREIGRIEAELAGG